ncbi:GTP-binding protein [Thermoleptolyngbya sichuanensis A183]|uniref:GTP-binding protein n=1 Tax=Thermoleptolyngbya sichuanensis A183 TaxID=2737172 RepID=A0A6M8BJ52_9CYAN|nr:GTP-binding protein [Thermoleptolyngbya sichuanensis]QKD83113.1 GTP-binding protein [Thermoleptolyngbya sichuanensis A183]
MRSPLLTLVAGPPGIGKTTWIRQQIAAAGQPAGYLNLGAGAVPLDGTYLAAELPNLFLWEEADLLDWELDERSCPLFVELGFQIDPSTLSLPRVAACRRVAVLPPAATQTEWHDWAEEVVVGGMGVSLLAMVSSEAQVLDLWRSPLTGQVFDPASLDTVWFELTHGAYGKVLRAKGLFDVADGRAFYFNFVNAFVNATAAPTATSSPSPSLSSDLSATDLSAAPPTTDYTELDLPRWLEGRPTRLSGVEVLGIGLDQRAIAQTLKDCCLDDEAIAYYQQQLKASLG